MAMDHREVGRYWDANAGAWTKLARAGYDVYRDHLNTPAFLELLPDVRGLAGLDVGCGDGHNTRLLAARGARMTALDISSTFVRHAAAFDEGDAGRIGYCVASAIHLPFAAATFDFATGFMSFMDIPEAPVVLSEVHRVLRPGGFLQFSLEHPCFNTPHRRHVRSGDGATVAIEVGGYFRRLDGEISEWIFGAAPPHAREGLDPFRIPRFTQTLSEWLNLVTDTGFVLERVAEPRPDDETVRAHPRLQDAQVVAYFLHLRARKRGPPSFFIQPAW